MTNLAKVGPPRLNRNKQRLIEFIRRNMFDEQHDKEPARLFRLSAAVEGNVSGNVLFDRKISTNDKPEDIGEDLWDQAGEDIDATGGSTLYKVRCYFGTTELEDRGGQYSWRLASESNSSDSDVLGVQSPNGAFAMMARLHEGTVRTALLQSADSTRAVTEALRVTMDALASLQTRLIDQTIRIEELHNSRSEREMAAKRMLMEEVRTDKIIDQVSLLAPALLSSRDGGNVAAINPLILSLVESLDDKTMENVLNALPKEEQKMAVIMLAKNLRELKDGKEAEEKKLKAEAAAIAQGPEPKKLGELGTIIRYRE